MLDPLWNQKVQFSLKMTKQIEDIELTVDKFEDQKVDKALPPPPPPLRRKLLDPRMSVMLFSELMDYNEGMSNMLGVIIYWTVEDF